MPRIVLPPRRIVIAFSVLAALAVIGFTALGALLDANKFRDIVAAQARAITGHELQVKGSTRLKLLPSPQLTLSNVELSVPPDKINPLPTLRAERLQVQIPWGSLFAKVPVLSQLTLEQPVLGIERSVTGGVNWDWLALPAGASLPAALSITGGKVVYTSPASEEEQRVENISLTLSGGAEGLSAEGKFSYLQQALMLEAHIPGASTSASVAEIRLWQNDRTALQLKLEKAVEEEKTAWRGPFQLQLEDLHRWLHAQSPVAPAGKMPPEAEPPYPLAAAGSVTYADGVVTVSDVSLQTPDSKGTGTLTCTLQDIPLLAVQAQFETLTLYSGALQQWFAPPKDAPAVGAIAVYENAEGRNLPKKLHLDLELTADTLQLDNTGFTNSSLKAALDRGSIHIENFSTHLGEEAAITLTGDITDSNKGLRFQGNTDTGGTSMRALLAVFDAAAEQLPAATFGEFALKANVFVSAEQMRLSEAQLKLAGLELVGGLVTYFELKPRVEAEITLQNTNLDYFRDSWRDEQHASGAHEFIFRINSSVDFSWLKQLKPVIDLKVNLERFQFLEQAGEFASFRIYARENEFGFYNVEMRYPTGTLKGKFTVNVAGELPAFDLDLQAPEFSTTYFSEDGKDFGAPLVNPDAPDNRWSARLFDLSWMIGVTGKFHFVTPRLTHMGEDYQRFEWQGTLADEQLHFDRLRFERFGGQVDATGTLVGGKVPGLTASYTIYNSSLAELLQSMSRLDKLSGRVSVSGTVQTSGISFQEWIRQLSAKMVIAGRGVRAEGFNLQGIVDAVNASRSVADVVTNVNRALPTGSTEFSVDGNLNIENGSVRTPGLSLQAGQAVAALNGEIDLIPWKMAVNIPYQMKMLQSETVPILGVDLVGAPDNYELKIDTTSLEAYVAKRIVGK